MFSGFSYQKYYIFSFSENLFDWSLFLIFFSQIYAVNAINVAGEKLQKCITRHQQLNVRLVLFDLYITIVDKVTSNSFEDKIVYSWEVTLKLLNKWYANVQNTVKFLKMHLFETKLDKWCKCTYQTSRQSAFLRYICQIIWEKTSGLISFFLNISQVLRPNNLAGISMK